PWPLPEGDITFSPQAATHRCLGLIKVRRRFAAGECLSKLQLQCYLSGGATMFGTTNSGSSEPIDAPPDDVGIFGYFLKLAVSFWTIVTGYTMVQPLSAPA